MTNYAHIMTETNAPKVERDEACYVVPAAHEVVARSAVVLAIYASVRPLPLGVRRMPSDRL